MYVRKEDKFGYKEKHKDDQKRLVISTKDIETTVNKNKYQNKYLALSRTKDLKQDKRPHWRIKKTCQRMTNPCEDPQGTWKAITKTKNSPMVRKVNFRGQKFLKGGEFARDQVRLRDTRVNLRCQRKD